MTPDRYRPLLDREFLKAELAYEYEDYLLAGFDATLVARLADWERRAIRRETQAEQRFIQTFFVETWSYQPDATRAERFQLWPRFPIAGAGQGGGRGEADLALGNFHGEQGTTIPQVVCEFKDIRSGLDAPQNRKGNKRSPVMQAKDYLWNARRGLFGNEAVQPRFAIVTDMDEFRLYWWDGFPDRFLRFKIGAGDIFNPISLIGEDEEARFDRFLFWRLFRPDMLLSDAGRTRLERLIEKQGKVERKLEDDFYADYRAYREVLITNIMAAEVPGLTRSGAVRLGQKLLDRLLFVMFAEDMGGRIGFPTNALTDQLRRFSEDPLLDADGDEVWRRLKLIFSIMNDGGDLGQATIHRFNGGLFEADDQIDHLTLPNRVFVRYGQHRGEAQLAQHKATLFYLACTYNFSRDGDAQKSIGLFTLGHIFEQSIVELDYLEARYEDRPSIAALNKRKRDGVYYTPEWVVRRIVEETLDPIFARWRAEAGWVPGESPNQDAARTYWERLRTIKVIDPACGSGAFLIVALDHLEREFTGAMRAAVESGALTQALDQQQITTLILRDCLYGVDINPASVEISKLSLWLHTARPRQPLSTLDDTIQCGNSLIDSRFYNRRRLDDAEERDRINVFEWVDRFAEGSFDAVIGNPPYVKLQNFVAVNADMAAWLTSGSTGEAPYRSTTTGNFDLYLPFIEKGLALLNDGGRMGYIAPSLWPTLDYGEGLRLLIHQGRHLEKWLDFRSFQIFKDVTTYTAIQIFTKAANEQVQLAFAPRGDISKIDWSETGMAVPYADIATPAQPWLLAPAPVRRMIDRLGRAGTRLDSPANTNGIIVGIQTSADHIYHLRRLGRNRYAYRPGHLRRPQRSDHKESRARGGGRHRRRDHEAPGLRCRRQAISGASHRHPSPLSLSDRDGNCSSVHARGDGDPLPPRLGLSEKLRSGVAETGAGRVRRRTMVSDGA